MRNMKPPQWSLEMDQSFNKDVGISTPIYSVSTPGVAHLADPQDQAREARAMNEYVAGVVAQNPRSSGFFALVPSLQYTDLALAEMKYALDHLHADGVTLFTTYGLDQYLGQEIFVPIWQELNARGAVVFIHPCDNGEHPKLFDERLPEPSFDWPHETGRTAMDLIIKGRIRQFPHVKIILSHGGGTLPLLARRSALITYPAFFGNPPMTADELYRQVKSFYFDTALSGSKEGLPLILGFAEKGHLLFGTEFPHATTNCSDDHAKFIDQFEMEEEEREDVYCGAARVLFPRLKK